MHILEQIFAFIFKLLLLVYAPSSFILIILNVLNSTDSK